MTYCVGLSLKAGVLFASDSRTNAGVDQIGKHCKMHVFEVPGSRVIVILNSGNLSITQNTLNMLLQATHNPDVAAPHLLNVASMFDVAGMVGEASRIVQSREAPFMGGVDMGANFIVGGQILGEPPRLFMVYNQGNFIEAGEDTCFFQIGETKYGKPIIDRVINRDTNLVDATKCVLVSFDSTIRSNISVGLPVDILAYETDSFRVGVRRKIEEDDDYYLQVHHQWGYGLREIFNQLPDPDWI